jgi:hypothetical protein
MTVPLNQSNFDNELKQRSNLKLDFTQKRHPSLPRKAGMEGWEESGSTTQLSIFQQILKFIRRNKVSPSLGGGKLDRVWCRLISVHTTPTTLFRRQTGSRRKKAVDQRKRPDGTHRSYPPMLQTEVWLPAVLWCPRLMTFDPAHFFKNLF